MKDALSELLTLIKNYLRRIGIKPGTLFLTLITRI